MNFSLNEIALKKKQAIIVHPAKTKTPCNINRILSFNAELMALGFIMSETLYKAIEILSLREISTLYNEIIPILKNIKGGDVIYQPLYPNFPKQVMETSETTLYLNALSHYWSMGKWLPQYPKEVRKIDLEVIKYQVLDLIKPVEVRAIFTTLLASKDSLSQKNKEIIQWFIENTKESKLKYPDEVPFLENKCLLAGLLLQQNKEINYLVSNATDILRIATYLSEGDISLATNCKFKSLSRPVRKILVKQLERVIREEDIGRHRKKWIKLFHSLHVGDYSKKVYKIAFKARNNLKIETFNGKIEYYLTRRYINKALSLLVSRPGDFGRRLDHIMRLATEMGQPKLVIEQFLSIVVEIPTRNLLQLLGHLHSGFSELPEKVVYPRGSVQKAVMIKVPDLKLVAKDIKTLVAGIEDTLIKRFSELETLNKVWIDPDLIDCPLPSQQRNSTDALYKVARGTRLPFDEIDVIKNTLRFFVYWKGQDIDLSATFHRANFSIMGHISYTQLKSTLFDSYHSGDIVDAPHGASEFIDINIAQALQAGVRYVAMNVLVFAGPEFSEHEICYAGWMMRMHPNSNEIFDAKTVQQKMDINAPCKNIMPAIFDLLERKVIAVDLGMSKRMTWGGNNIESNQATIEQKMAAMVTNYNKLSLYELFELQTKARGKIVETKVEAETIFSLDEGITPFDIDKINAEFIG